jgi:hypothetical protein
VVPRLKEESVGEETDIRESRFSEEQVIGRRPSPRA